MLISAAQVSETPFNLYVGRAVFGPSDLVSHQSKPIRENSFFSYYSDRFNTVFLDSVYFESVGSSRIQHWQQQLQGKEFRFLILAHHNIAHHTRLCEARHISAAFADHLQHYAHFLGAVVLSLPENYSVKRFGDLCSYLQTHSFPRLAIMFCDKQWYHPRLLQNLNRVLLANRSTVVFEDKGDFDFSLINHLPFHFIVVQFHFIYTSQDVQRLKAWIHFIRCGREKSLMDCYFIFYGEETRVEMMKMILWLGVND